MPDIGVGPQSFQDAATGSREMAGELRGVDARAADRLKQAMPDSGAATNATQVGDYWNQRLRRLSSTLDKRAGKLNAASDEYEDGERDAKADFDGTIDPGPGKPGK